MSEPYAPGKSYPVMAYANAFGIPLALAYQFVWWRLQGCPEEAPDVRPFRRAMDAFWNRVKGDVRLDMHVRPIGKSPALAAPYGRKDPIDFCGMTGTRKPVDVDE